MIPQVMVVFVLGVPPPMCLYFIKDMIDKGFEIRMIADQLRGQIDEVVTQG